MRYLFFEIVFGMVNGRPYEGFQKDLSYTTFNYSSLKFRLNYFNTTLFHGLTLLKISLEDHIFLWVKLKIQYHFA
jgi:hypothetical protein